LLLSFFLIWYQDGGDEENRTPDPLLARQMLSQLSYTPILGFIVCPGFDSVFLNADPFRMSFFVFWFFLCLFDVISE
jgi:hypothetical protein